MKTAQDIINIIKDSGADNVIDVIAVLEDGEALAMFGITDDDIGSVEVAYDLIMQGLKKITNKA